MRKTRLICGLSLALACTSALAGGLPWEKQESTQPKQYILIRLKSDDAEEAAKLIEGMGKIAGRLRNDDRFRIELAPGVDPVAAIKELSANPEVTLAIRATGFDNIIFSSMSLDLMTKRQKELRAKADARPQAEKDEILELQNKLRGELGIDGSPEVKKSYKGTGLGYYDARKHYIQQRAYPNDSIDKAAYKRAVAHRSRMSGTNLSSSEPGMMETAAVSLNRWEFIGPRNLDAPYNLYFGPRPAAGRVNAVAYQKSDTDTYYVGTAGGGVHKTTDAGLTWTGLSDEWPFMNVSSIAVQPWGSTVYVGTGDFPGWGGYGAGLFKSFDGGNSWKQIGVAEGFDNYAISDILIVPDRGQTLLATLGRGDNYWGTVWKSDNFGEDWTQVIGVGAGWSDLSISIRGTSGELQRIYAAASGGVLYRSDDLGDTWTALANPFSTNLNYPLDVEASKVARDTVYAMDNASNRIWKSTNAGVNWTEITGNLDPGPGGYNFSQSWYDTHLTVSKNGSADVLYVGLVDIQQSLDAAGTWRTLGYGFQQNSTLTQVHVDHHSMTFHPFNPNEALVTSDGGVYKFVFDPVADTWTFTSLNDELGITQFYAFDIHPTDEDIVIGGTQDNSTPYSFNGDLQNWENVAGGDGGFCAINPVDPDNMYATSQFLNVYRTDNNWSGLSNITPGIGSDRVLFIAPIELDKNNPDLLYAGTNFLWRYSKSANSWTARLGGVDLASTNGAISEIAVAPGASNRLYVGTNNGKVWYSDNSGSTWVQINTGTVSLPNRYITSISVNPNNINDILVGVSGTGTGHLWRCNNVLAGATRTWSNVSGTGLTGLPDISLNDIVRDPDGVATSWHVATDVGVFTTFNSGGTWTNSTNPLGLPNVQVNQIKINGRNLYAATFGRGIWRVRLPARNATISISLNKSSLVPSETFTGTVTLANPAPTGGQPVSINSDHFSVWVPDTITVSAGQTTKTFTGQGRNFMTQEPTKVVTITASRPGSVASTTVTTRSNYGKFFRHTMTDKVFAGETYPTWIRFRNIGGTTWNAANDYVMMSRNPTNNLNWGLNEITLPGTLNVGPNTNHDWFAVLTAPSTAGTYAFQWSLRQNGVAEFPDWSPPFWVQVQNNPGHAASFVSQSVPTSVARNTNFNASITFQNTGTTTWTDTGNFWLYSQQQPGNTTWGADNVTMPGGTSITPGNSHTFTRTFTAPSTPGTYSFRWRMSVDDAAFGPLSPTVTITVT